MKKSILFLGAALAVISVSMTSYSTSEARVETCKGRFTLERELIDEMTKKYRNTQLQHINDELKLNDGYGDAREIWFSLDVLKDFICQIENEIDTTSENLGIRFYYAAYPKKAKWKKHSDLMTVEGIPKVPLSYAERHTLILVPTIKKDCGPGLVLNQDYIPQQGNMLAAGPAHHYYFSMPSPTFTSDEDDPAKNHGSLIPPGG